MTFTSGLLFRLIPVFVIPEHPLQLAVNALAETVNSLTTLSESDRDGVFATDLTAFLV